MGGPGREAAPQIRGWLRGSGRLVPRIRWPTVGTDWASISEALEVMQTRARRHHDRWLAVRCPECPAEVATTLGKSARPGTGEA